MTISIEYRAGSGGLFDRVRWRCTGAGEGCGVWMASAWDWAPAMAAEHVATRHPNSRSRVFDVRDQAVANVDARHGYTYEFSHSPEAHLREYDEEERRLRGADA